MNTEKFRKILWQIGIIFALCLLGEVIAAVLPIAFPGSVISMVILFILLVVKLVKPAYIAETSGFLRDNMSFLFVPSSVGIMQHFSTLGSVWFPFLVICLVSTVLTFFVTSVTVGLVMKIQALAVKNTGKAGRS